MAPQSAPAGATLGAGCTARPGVNRAQNATFSFDALGKLIGRGDAPNGQAWETFGYDLLNRLTTQNGVNVASYYADGRLYSRSGITGFYGYQTGTHRVNSAGGYSLGYDNNGNVTTLIGNGTNKTLTYLAFNLPSRIQAEGNTLDYRYDAAHARLKETAQTPQGSSSTYYLGAFEEHTRNDGVVELRHYLLTPEGAVGIVTRRSNAQNDTRYWFKDHLGSIVAITDGAGTAKQRFTYDPWGKRSVVPIVNADANAEERGFTGHEHLTEAGLIHMNGRLYFDALGRMLQADPIIQAPYDGQNYDRYAYVFNNPLSLIDPTGYSAWTRIRAPVAGIIVTLLTYGAMSAAATAAAGTASAACNGFAGTAFISASGSLTVQGAMVAGAAGGFAAGGLSSGNIEGALQGALQGAVFGALNFGIGNITTGAGNVFGEYATAANIALHAVVGCAQSAAAGGSCKGGAASGGFSAAAGAVGLGGGVVGRAVVGAMASKLAGGRAGDGAMVAVFDYLFNDISHWQRAQQVAAESLRTAGWVVEEGVKVFVHGLPGDLSAIGYADFIATRNGEVLIGEVKSGLHPKLTDFQKFLLSSDGALGRLEIASAERALALGLDAGRPLAAQLSAGAKIMYTLTGELGGRAASQWAARNAGALATKVLFNGLRVIGSVPVMLLIEPGN